MPKVFISATTRDLKSYRTLVTDWARENGYDPVVEEELLVQSDYGTIVQMLREKLDPCVAVIHLAGLFYGSEPTNRPDGEARRSYTQLEYELGKVHKKQVFRFIARKEFQADDSLDQIKEQLFAEILGFTEELFAKQCDLQRQHRQRLMQGNEAWSPTSRTTGNELYYEFSNHDELKKLLDKIEIKARLDKPQNLPTVGSLFKGRDEFIEQLHRVLTSKPTHIAAVTAKQAIHGLGGVGKTRVAVEYAKRFSHEYTALLFITADSPSNLQRNLANLCGALVLNLPEKDVPEQEVQVAAALRWLREHSGWFLIIDNVDTSEAAQEVEGLLQQLDTGHVVVTSRVSQWACAVEELALDVISETAATEFLLERTQGNRTPTTTDEADAIALARDLGRLPLALEQAGAFIVKHHGSLQEYSARWKQQEAKVLQWHDQRSMKYPASVATTWQTSFDLLSHDGRGLLNVLCWLAPDPIPLTMIQKLSAIGDKPPIDIESGLANLAEYSLLNWTSVQHDFVEVHRLVQEITRHRLPISVNAHWLKRTFRRLISSITRYRLPESESKHWLQRALRMVNDFVPVEPTCYDVRSWPSIYVPGQGHIAALIQSADARQIFEPTTRLMSCLAGYFQSRAALPEAEPLMRRALAIDEQSVEQLSQLSPVSETKLLSAKSAVASHLNNLAGLLQATNRLSEAEPLMRRALAIDEQSYGKEHPNVARHLNNLALLLHATNRLSEAEPLMRRALAIDEQSYGKEHPDVARDLNNLAQLFQATNRLSEAEPLMRRALAIDEQSYGKEHPRVAIDLNNLALLLQETNRLSEVEPLMRRALAIDEQSYGTEHPLVAIRLNNLAQLLQATNRLSEAEPLMRRALAIDEQSYGKEHPAVARDLNNLAQLLQDTNRLSEAEPLMRRALAIDEQSYGTEHPDVARDLNNLAQLLQATNRLSEAEPLMRRALAIDEQSYGTEHPNVARDLNNLAQLLQTTNRLSEAEPLMGRALAIDEQSYGTEHTRVAIELNNLAQLLQATNRLSEAEPLMRRALAIDEQSYGTEHPKVAIRLNNLAQLLKATNRLSEAEPLIRRALAIDEQSYGTEHPDVARDLNNLAWLLKETNRLSEAEPLMRRALDIFTKCLGNEHPNTLRVQRNLNALLEEM